jgi:acetoacetate decarboxylase
MTLVSAPLHPDATLYGAFPWRFFGHTMTVLAECDARAVAALVPAPLKPWGAPIVRFSVHELTCDLGFGRAWALANPHRSRLREAVVGIAVEHDGVVGHWDPFLWTDSDAECAVGREMYGWPQRIGTLAVTLPDPFGGFAAGDVVSGRVARFTDPVFRADIVLERSGEPEVPQPPFVGFYTERALPDPAARRVVRELFFSEMAALRHGEAMTGRAEIQVFAPELAALKPRAIAGRVGAIAWVKEGSRLVARTEQAF